MTPDQIRKFNDAMRKVDELYAFMQLKKQQQLSFPLDINSMQALNDALRSVVIDRINVKDIFFQATQESPTEEGQMRFFNDRSTQTFRVTTTKGVFTGTIDLTAV